MKRIVPPEPTLAQHRLPATNPPPAHRRTTAHRGSPRAGFLIAALATAGLTAAAFTTGCQSSRKDPQATSPTAGASGSGTTAAANATATGQPGAGVDSPISKMRQWTHVGPRAGEGYFSADGRYFVFQSEREKDNPFYQIYLQDTQTGSVKRISPGTGKTSCAWVHPENDRVLFASTHEDPKAKQAQKEELKFRASGKKRRYSWDFDTTYDIYVADENGKNIKNLTKALGYDAEGSFSPDGQWIAFSSNRHAYVSAGTAAAGTTAGTAPSALTPQEQALFAKDPSGLLDIYLMRADGSEVRRLTTELGYDGGPFFSPDGSRIIWRHFSPDGQTAEVFTMALDGSDKKQLTKMGAMSWAPFYHPSGDYVIFTTNKHGHANFELYIVDVEGKKEPVRVTDMAGFDGLPVFHPSGAALFWTRTLGPESTQIVWGEWDDAKARRLLGLPAKDMLGPEIDQASASLASERQGRLGGWVKFFASENLKGRPSGSPEETIWTEKVAAEFARLGLQPAGDKKTYFQTFPFEKGLRLGPKNRLTVERTAGPSSGSATGPGSAVGAGTRPAAGAAPAAGTALVLDQDWRPLARGAQKTIKPSQVVFAGYGIHAPPSKGQPGYNSYAGLDVRGKWVLVFRHFPENVSPERRAFLARYSRLAFKMATARHQGALGMIVVNGPNAQAKQPLMPLTASPGQEMPVISLRDEAAAEWLTATGKTLKEWQDAFDNQESLAGLPLPGLKIGAYLDVDAEKGDARNVLGLLAVPGAKETVVIGAHGDHLGVGHSEGSLMKEQNHQAIHYGADDNASGMAGVLELAHELSEAARTEPRLFKRNLLFAIWSGEERGNLGSSYFVETMRGGSSQQGARHRRQVNLGKIVAYLNMDMIGRLGDSLAVQATGSSRAWPTILERVRPRTGLIFEYQEDPYLPTDSMAFYLGGVPTLNFFTGAHPEYHTPQDRFEKVNLEGLESVVETVGLFSLAITEDATPLPYQKMSAQPTKERSRGFRLYLGTIPDYTKKDVKGVLLSGVVEGGPAARAGLKVGDILVKLGGVPIASLHDYVYALEAGKPGAKTDVTVIRSGATITHQIVPESRE